MVPSFGELASSDHHRAAIWGYRDIYLSSFLVLAIWGATETYIKRFFFLVLAIWGFYRELEIILYSPYQMCYQPICCNNM